jgi:hypothetical protein
MIKRLFVKLISAALTFSLFTGCMTVGSDNRSESVSELRKVNKISTAKLPVENDIGPVYRINARTDNAGLMVAGQMGIELGYKYFVITDTRSISNVSGYMYKGYGGVSTTTIITITVAYTNEEGIPNKYNAQECSTLMDGYKFTTFNGRVACWSLFGASLVGGTAVMLSAFNADYDDPRGEQGLIGGAVLMSASILFAIPLFY